MGKDAFPPLFKDFGKKANDVFSMSKYELGRSFEFTTKSNGVDFKATGNVEGKNTSNLNIKTPLDFADLSADINMNGKISGAFTWKEIFDGTTLTTTVNTNSSDIQNMRIGSLDMKNELKFVRDNFVATGTSNGTRLLQGDVSLAMGIDKIAIGGRAFYSGGRISDYSVGAEYQEGDFRLTLTTAERTDKVVASCVQGIGGGWTAVARGAFDVRNLAARNIQLGGIYDLDRDTKVTSVVSAEGGKYKSCTCYETKFNSNTSIAVGAIVDVNNISLNSTKFGVKVTFNN